MLRWSCPNCSQEIFFNSFLCLGCQTPLAFSLQRLKFEALDSVSACANRADHGLCNWQTEGEQSFCRSCSANSVIPDLSVDGNLEKWQKLEDAKRRLYFSCFRLGIDVSGLTFRFLANTAEGRVMTGHCDGVITINIEEADDAIRERNRTELQEEFRTLMGHFRHEFGHFFWAQEVSTNTERLEQFRKLFGDERVDYQTSLENYRASNTVAGPDFITEYASSHPWEDWAESFAHYLHLRDVLETAREFGFSTLPFFEFQSGMEEWIRMTVAFNEINRSMGLSDLYPFALTPPVKEKLKFVHDLVEM